MIQKYAFTTVAMAAALGDTPVSYDDLAEIEKEFDDVEIEISTCALSPKKIYQPLPLKNKLESSRGSTAHY